ncbi:signal peptide containing protein [Cryptosporidium felis]|nr:signal peptide containing protein [Cryptosporidium felis]
MKKYFIKCYSLFIFVVILLYEGNDTRKGRRGIDKGAEVITHSLILSTSDFLFPLTKLSLARFGISIIPNYHESRVNDEVSLVQLLKKKSSADKRRKKEEKRRKKEEKKLEKQRKKEEKKQKSQAEKAMKKKDKEDEKAIKNKGKSLGLDSTTVKNKLKEVKKSLKTERNSNPNLTLMEHFNQSGGFGDAAGSANSAMERVSNNPEGQSAGTQSDGDDISTAQTGGVGATTSLTKEEKKAQKKQDKENEKKLKKDLVAGGMSKSDAKKEVKERKKLLKALRKTNPRATIFDVNSDSPMGAGMAAEGEGIESRLSVLEAKVQKLEQKNRKRKSENKQLLHGLKRLARAVSSMRGGGASNDAFDDD